MIKKGTRVRVKGTDIAGRVKSIDQEAGVCRLDMDYDLVDLSPDSEREFALSALIELRKVRGTRRLEILSDFDLIHFAAQYVRRLGEPHLLIRKTEAGYSLQYERPWRKGGAEAHVVLEGHDTERLLAEVGKLKAHEWGKGFWPPPDTWVLDGESWAMDFFKDGDFFHAEGDNAAPQELFAFHDFIASLGLPRMEALDAIESNGWEASTISPHERLEICREANHQDAHVFADNGKKQAHFDM